MIIRSAAVEDAREILQIYAPYVTGTAITFEYDVPELEEFSGRIANTLRKYPYLAAVEDGRIVGYAYAGAFRPRAAYRYSAEVSIYVDSAFRGRGIGKALYQELEKRLFQQQIYVLYACITETERKEDPYLTDASIRFHEKMGYHLAGRFFHCGYKFDRWYSMIWMEKEIRPRSFPGAVQ